MKTILTGLLIVLVFGLSAAAQDSILASRIDSQNHLTKAGGKSARQYLISLRSAIESQAVESQDYRGYTILLHPMAGDFEVQVFKNVSYGTSHVSSIFASKFQSSYEYVYSYDSNSHEIRRDHFLFPPNSLTGWGDPNGYLTMKRFDWNEKFPSKKQGCYVYTSEEFGREYVEAGCFKSRDAALRFSKKFITYILSDRGV